eukprot:21631-Eustigmatos_ZCMA.PRE.1
MASHAEQLMLTCTKTTVQPHDIDRDRHRRHSPTARSGVCPRHVHPVSALARRACSDTSHTLVTCTTL